MHMTATLFRYLFRKKCENHVSFSFHFTNMPNFVLGQKPSNHALMFVSLTQPKCEKTQGGINSFEKRHNSVRFQE